MRKTFIAGNWKMNNTIAGSMSLAIGLIEKLADENDVEIGIAPPFTALFSVAEKSLKSNIALIAQNMHYEKSGAFTGEISPPMLSEIGVKYVILGHSERRHVFGETDELINKKVLSCYENDLTPILCIGEKQEEREAGKTFEVLETQLAGGLEGVSADLFAETVIAYEPVWAIGTGLTATPEIAAEAHQRIREWLAKNYHDETAEATRILYGGSVKPDNVAELLSKPDLDGALVGGASLKIDSFVELVKNS